MAVAQNFQQLAQLSYYLESSAPPTSHSPRASAISCSSFYHLDSDSMGSRVAHSILRGEDEGESVPGHQGTTGFAAPLRVFWCRMLRCWPLCAICQFCFHFWSLSILTGRALLPAGSDPKAGFPELGDTMQGKELERHTRGCF